MGMKSYCLRQVGNDVVASSDVTGPGEILLIATVLDADTDSLTKDVRFNAFKLSKVTLDHRNVAKSV